jgi:hypothetical protein
MREQGTSRRGAITIIGGSFCLLLLCAVLVGLLSIPSVSNAIGRHLPSGLANTPVPYLLTGCNSYPPWERWTCATRPITGITNLANGAPCTYVEPQWRAEQKLQQRLQAVRQGQKLSAPRTCPP